MVLVPTLDTANPPVPSGKYAVSISSFLRSDNATAYSALDVISDGDGVNGAMVFPGCGRSGAIRGVHIINRLETDTITPRLWVFDAEPTNFDDGDAFALVTADVPKIVGFFDFVDADKILIGTLINFYSATRATADGAFVRGPVPYASADGNLFGLLQTVAGYTPIALTQWTIKLQVEHD